ncbi:MAG TPA: glycogen-binding domain-containing protein [Candidatus Acidoferrum sp.]|jgi:1,4-alpha-glucan branching enzyme|nr:glycogen-binding domain-containing protein [Candidatus Acidoferrum sp.]
MQAIQDHSNSDNYSAKDSIKPVNFYFVAPQAHAVEIAGDFNHWQPFLMQRLLDGWWFVRLELCHGHHQYRFMVDGMPQLDPHAMGSSLDEHNERVSLIAVG